MWVRRHCRKGEGGKVEIVWTRNENRLRRACQRHYEMKRPEDVGFVDIAETMREARLSWYEHVMRRSEGEPVSDISERRDLKM